MNYIVIQAEHFIIACGCGVLLIFISFSLGIATMKKEAKKKYGEREVREENIMLKESNYNKDKIIKQQLEIIESQQVKLKGIAALAAGIKRSEE